MIVMDPVVAATPQSQGFLYGAAASSRRSNIRPMEAVKKDMRQYEPGRV